MFDLFENDFIHRSTCRCQWFSFSVKKIVSRDKRQETCQLQYWMIISKQTYQKKCQNFQWILSAWNRQLLNTSHTVNRFFGDESKGKKIDKKFCCFVSTRKFGLNVNRTLTASKIYNKTRALTFFAAERWKRLPQCDALLLYSWKKKKTIPQKCSYKIFFIFLLIDTHSHRHSCWKLMDSWQ